MVKMSVQDSQEKLNRTFGMRECVTITVGTVVGVGLFTVGANVVGMMGASVILATAAALLISIYPAWLYAEMGAALPYAGGTYKYASIGLGRPFGMLAGWNFIISLVAVTSGEALAFSFYCKTFFSALGCPLPISDTLLAGAVIVAFIITNVRGVEMTGRLQNGFMYFFWGVALVWFCMMFPKVNPANFAQLPSYVDFTPAGFIGATALIWWCFAGFETCCAMGEEIKYPQINIPRALFLAPFIVFAVNAAFQWFLVGIVPTAELGKIAEAAAPYAEAMKIAGILGFPLVMLAAGIAFGGDFSTLNASIAVPPRYLYTMARDGAVPAIFAKVHPKYKTPYVSIIALGLLSVFLIISNSMVYIASLSLFADLFYYVIGIAAAYGLRVKAPKLDRPYKAPYIKIGVPVSMAIYLVMMTQLDREAFWTGALWCLAGLAVFYICRRNHSADSASVESYVMKRELPSPAEAAAMDREYKIWKTVVIISCILVVLLYCAAWLIK